MVIIIVVTEAWFGSVVGLNHWHALRSSIGRCHYSSRIGDQTGFYWRILAPQYVFLNQSP